MILMNFLRILVDLSFYGAFAGFFALKCGGQGAFAGMLLQCVCFSLSSAAKKSRAPRMLLLLSMLLGFYWHRGSVADCVLLIPSAVYILRLAFKGDYALSQERQQQLFSVFWKALAIFTPLAMLMWSTAELAAVTMPYALAMLAGSVLLMRALRHDPQVYCRASYQLTNLAAVALVITIAYLASRQQVLNAAAAMLQALYDHLIRPLLEILLTLLFYAMSGVSWLFAWLSAFFKGEPQPQKSLSLDLTGFEELLGNDLRPKEPSELMRILGLVFLVAAGATVLFLFFRWLNKWRGDRRPQEAVQENRDPIDAAKPALRQRETSPVRRIRAQYRKFLKLCANRGAAFERCATSLDVHHQASLLPGPDRVSDAIRALYIRARYAGQAEAEDAQTMKRLYTEAKKGTEDNCI